MSSLLYAELAATCSALGYFDGNKYYIDIHCQETIKDLIRYLRRDDENHEIRRYIGEAKILQADLLPMLKDYWEKADLFDVILRLLVNLTNPALLLYREELPAEKTSRNYYLQIITHLQSYKAAFCDDRVWALLSMKLGDILKIDSMEREEEKGLVIERILILVRNVLQVPADPDVEKRTDNDASVHDQVLWALHQSGMVDLFLYIACSENEQQYYMHILEIVSLMLREQNPAQLADAAITRSVEDKERDEAELLAIRQEEIRQRQAKVKKFTGARHSRFGGTYVLKDMKSIGDSDIIYHKPLNKLDSLDFDQDKTKQRRPKNRLPMRGEELQRRSAFSIRLFLKEFCVEFLNGAYNTLMYHVKDGLVRAKAQANDESYYLWAMKFFMEFNRNYKFQVKLVSETMSVQTFHYVQTQMENCYDALMSDKKKMLLWSRRMHLALRAYQELLMTLTAMDKSDNLMIWESSKVIKSNIFYVVEYRELILTLLLNFDEIKFTKSYLKDLIETAHVFMKLLEHFCTNRSIVVQKRTLSRKRKTKKSTQRAQEGTPSLDELWDEIGPQISAVFQNDGIIPSDVVPFDAASDRDMDEQKVDAMRKIQTLLRNQQFEEAIGLLRASREVWPENDSFGNANMAPEEEFMAVRDIFMADIQNPELVQASVAAEAMQENHEEEEDEEEQQAANISVGEQDFKFIDFARRFVHYRVVQACSLLLKQFEKNLAHTNHCIAKMLHRIAWDCKAPSMLFQASLFQTFQHILDSKQGKHKELATLALFIVRKFTEVANTNSKVYMELLFWKTSRDVYDIENGYGSYEEKTHSSKQVWNEEEEEELHHLYQEFTKKAELEGGDSGQDVVDWILQNLINTSRSHRGVSKKLRELGYNVGNKRSRKSGNVRPPKEWAGDEEQQLRELYEEFRVANDPLGCIIDRLKVHRPKHRIIEKLLEMGLIQDRKELRKKRAKKSRDIVFPDASGWESVASDESDSAEDSDSGNEDCCSDGGAANRMPAARVTQPKQKQDNTRGRKKSAASKKEGAPNPYSSAELISCFNEVINAGMTDALRWVSSSLQEVVDDREADGEEETIPLVPISEEAMTAMENPQFLKLLTALNIVPPSDEQEIYWRIPGNLSVHDLKKRIEIINQALDGSLIAQHSGEEIEGSAGNGQDKDADGNINILNYTHSEEAEFSNKHTAGTKIQNVKKNKTSDSSNKNRARKVRKNIQIDSDSETEELNHNSLAQTGEHPENIISGETPRNKVKIFMLDSATNEKSHNSMIWKDDAPNAEGSGIGGDLNRTTKKKLSHVIFDSESETEEISLSSLVQKNHILDTKSITDGSSCGTTKNIIRSVVLNSDSENEVTGAQAEQTRCESKRVLSGSDSDAEISHSIKRSKTTFSADDADTMVTEERHSEEEINGSTYMQKHKRRIILSDDEDD